MNKDFNYKVVYDLKIKHRKKELKLDENNQYDNGMTKPLPTVCIKNDPDLSCETFNFLLEKVICS